ncbi:MAG: hypothetical protein QNJ71_02510 [Acidimicrobiia bacterium]|nr:hypothetical protein [Acidimicrobiia bacterium]
MTTYRCSHCGNKTRFDVYETVRRRRYEHADLSGQVTVEEEDVFERSIDRVVCRWCDRDDGVDRDDFDRDQFDR